MSEPKSLRRYLTEQAILIAVFNAVMNGGYTWWLWHAQAELALFTGPRIALDLAGTPAFIAFLSTSLGTVPTRRVLHAGKVLAGPRDRRGLLRYCPRGVIARSLLAAAVAMLVFSLPLWLALRATGIVSMTPWEACLTKVGLTVALSLVIVPVIIWITTHDPAPETVDSR